ncbi:cysteine synthase A [Ardenticatena maritima]|uniref:cysteine synthase n=1 Tax=Ardenticatena maritima TaxID=872965 RepID=A0A0M8KBQ9_9CHLR|nr:cysteine synthase family protein [Ardenticatena maritima]KPL87889.1 hypothetical protein SE16_10145 [Ardenticatena maritima]GAP64326.1 cysteine synthase A [Ardenticatena maritima]
MIAQNSLNLIGNTPLVALNSLARHLRMPLYLKLETANPTHSDTDRVALAIIESAERQGLVDLDTVIIEPTAGNIAFSLAMVCAARGYRLVLVLPDWVPEWRIRLLRAMGADVHVTHGMNNAFARADELANAYPKVFRPRQFANAAAAEAHQQTAQEIWRDTDGAVQAVVIPVTTGAACTGIGTWFKHHQPHVRVIAVQPAESPVLTGGKPGNHHIYGMGAPFVPTLYNDDVIDHVIDISTSEAYEALARLLRMEGLLVGPSSGAAVAGALKFAQTMATETTPIVALALDSIERYVQTDVMQRVLNSTPMLPR